MILAQITWLGQNHSFMAQFFLFQPLQSYQLSESVARSNGKVLPLVPVLISPCRMWGMASLHWAGQSVSPYCCLAYLEWKDGGCSNKFQFSTACDSSFYAHAIAFHIMDRLGAVLITWLGQNHSFMAQFFLFQPLQSYQLSEFAQDPMESYCQWCQLSIISGMVKTTSIPMFNRVQRFNKSTTEIGYTELYQGLSLNHRQQCPPHQTGDKHTHPEGPTGRW